MALDYVRIRYWTIVRCTYQQLLEQMESWLVDGASHYVCFCDGNGMPRAWHDDLELREAYARADAVCADGIAIDWLARICGGGAARLTGPKLFVAAMEYGIKRGWRHYFYGTNQETLNKLAKQMVSQFPGVNVVGMFAPGFAEDPAPPPIAKGEVDILWVALGCPKQEKWCARHVKKLGVPIVMPVGAAFDFHSGAVAKTPEWIESLGLCWLWRLLTGGRRVFFRNLNCVSRACWVVVCEFIRVRILKRAIPG